MNKKTLRSTFSHPTPELPVMDVERAQQHYHHSLGFEIGWLTPEKEIGAMKSLFSSGEGTNLSSPPFIGYLQQISMPHTPNCNPLAHELLSLLR